MSKQPHGNGTVFQRKDGRWVAQAYVNGKKWTKYAKNEREGRRKLRDLWREPPTPVPRLSSVPTVQDFAALWLTSSGYKQTTIEAHGNNFRLNIAPIIGGLRLDGVTVPDVVRVITVARNRGLSDRSVQYTYAVLRRLLQVAVEWGVLETNPAARVKRPKATPPERHPWGEAHTALFIHYCQTGEGVWNDLFLVALLSGLRAGELLGLEWQDVDWQRGTISVRRSLAELRGGEGFRIQTPKTKAALRMITLPAVALEALKGRKSLGREGGYVFRRPSGNPPRRNDLCEALRSTCKRACVPYPTVHGLRHQHASLLAHAGVPVKAAQQRLGHSSATTTLNIYTHLLGDADKRAVESLEVLLGGEP